MRQVYRGEIYFADLGATRGSEQHGERPVVIIQNDIGNEYSPTTIVAVITSQVTKASLPTHVEINTTKFDSVILLEQIRTIDKSRLMDCVCTLSEETMLEIDAKLSASLGINYNTFNSKWIKWLDSFFTRVKNFNKGRR